jgi:hypothetical protein
VVMGLDDPFIIVQQSPETRIGFGHRAGPFPHL